jgi:hypothetical protein
MTQGGSSAQQGETRGSGGSSTQKGAGSGEKSNDARGGTQAQGAVPGTTDRSTSGGADRAGSGQGGSGSTAQGSGQGGDRTQQGGGTRDAQGAGSGSRQTDQTRGGDQNRSGAQTQTQTQTETRTEGKQTNLSVTIKPEQKTVIKQTIVRENVRPAKIDVQIRVGAVVPRTVELRPLPATIIEIVPAYRSYRYILVDEDTIVIVDPTDWTIVDVINV